MSVKYSIGLISVLYPAVRSWLTLKRAGSRNKRAEDPTRLWTVLFPAGKSLMWTGPCSTRRTILM